MHSSAGNHPALSPARSPTTRLHPCLLAVSEANPGNPLLQMRGNAGSHDMQLGTETLQALQGATGASSSVALPRCAARPLPAG